MARPQHAVKKPPPHLRSTGCTPETVFVMVETVAQQASAQVEQSAQRARHACTAGCTFCCHLPVDVTVPEALSIAAYVQQSLSPATLAALHARIAATAMQINRLSYEDHTQAKIPCALLMDGRCLVYSQRPLACRAWNSTSKERCEHIFRHGDPLTMLPPLDMPAYEAVWKLAQDMMDDLKQARLDSHTYELHSILLRVLETPEAAARWLQHDKVFAGCLIGAYTHDA